MTELKLPISEPILEPLLESWVELTDGENKFVMTQDEMRRLYLRFQLIFASARVVPRPANKILVVFSIEQTAWMDSGPLPEPARKVTE